MLGPRFLRALLTGALQARLVFLSFLHFTFSAIIPTWTAVSLTDKGRGRLPSVRLSATKFRQRWQRLKVSKRARTRSSFYAVHRSTEISAYLLALDFPKP